MWCLRIQHTWLLHTPSLHRWVWCAHGPSQHWFVRKGGKRSGCETSLWQEKKHTKTSLLLVFFCKSMFKGWVINVGLKRCFRAEQNLNRNLNNQLLSSKGFPLIWECILYFQVPAGGGIHRHHFRCKIPKSSGSAGTCWRRRRQDGNWAFSERDGHNNKGHRHQGVSTVYLKTHSNEKGIFLIYSDLKFHFWVFLYANRCQEQTKNSPVCVFNATGFNIFLNEKGSELIFLKRF